MSSGTLRTQEELDPKLLAGHILGIWDETTVACVGFSIGGVLNEYGREAPEKLLGCHAPSK